MSQFRKDPFGSAWVLISPERGLESSDFGSTNRSSASSPLSPGNELQFPEIQAVRPSTSATNSPEWSMRVIEHPSALLHPKGFDVCPEGLFVSASSSGFQELIVEHPDSRMTLDDMPHEHLVGLLKLYRDRLAFLADKPDVKHVQITRNVGEVAGALYAHPHAQVLAMPVTNRWIDEEQNASEAYSKEHQRCLFCDVIEAELQQRERIISVNEAFVALAPYASKTPFEMWILPRQHSDAFRTLASNSVPLLADMLQSVIRAMNHALNHPPYNLIVHTLPKSHTNSYHWHIEILPRLTVHAGFDWGNGFYINPTPPEDAVRFLREALALQEVGL